tara:strand:- start:1453 stop:1668 length:216 start_codon:yes stop_codon:yes gene_type:complete
MKSKITDRQLMKFADGELNNKELAMDIVAKILEDSPEGDDLRKRLNVFVKTRSVLKSLLAQDIHKRKDDFK